MKNDLDSIMTDNGIDAILTYGDGLNNPAMVYLTGGGHFSAALCVKRVNEPAILIHDPMEREEAARSGLQTIDISHYPIEQFIEESPGNDPFLALAYRQAYILREIGLIGGKIAIYGRVNIELNLPIIQTILQLLPALKIVGPNEFDVLATAMITKDNAELSRIRKMGKITTEVVSQVKNYLSSRKVRNDVLYFDDETPLTIGVIKRKINLWLAERGAENPHGTIFALGRDAGIPHSAGQDDDVIQLGVPIVFDIYPCEAGGGYHYDFTRTWSLGYASDEVLQLHSQVMTVYETILSDIQANQPFSIYQKRVCEQFSEMGHPTVLDTPSTQAGYVHSLGHGLGLKIHEKPFSSLIMAKRDALVPGAVFTIEPGLYYPERDMGVRIEDSYYMDQDGRIHCLADYPYDLIIPMEG